MTFPATERGRERAREFVAAHTGRAEIVAKSPHQVLFLSDFHLCPIGTRAPKVTRMPSVGALLSKR